MLKWLEDYEFLATWIELAFFVIVFIFFELRNYVKDKKEKREKDIYYKIKLFANICIRNFLDYYKLFLDKQDKKKLWSVMHNYSSIDDKICKEISDKTKLPFMFCKRVIFGTLITLEKQFIPYQKIDYYHVYNYLFNCANSVLEKEVFTKIDFNKMKKYFKNNKEIDELYNILLNYEKTN